MKKPLLVLSFTLGLANVSNADTRSIFKGEFKDNPSYSECVKAIQKGVHITTNQKNGAHVFFYKDKICTIIGGSVNLVCLVGADLK